MNQGDEAFSAVTRLVELRREVGSRRVSELFELGTSSLFGFGGARRVDCISLDDWGNASDWFLIGDIHGDFFALANGIAHVFQNPNARLIFLGDLVDRGPLPLDCLWLLLTTAIRFPRRVLWLAGNHDIGFTHEADGTFRSGVYPAEFLDELNLNDSMAPSRRDIGRYFIELANRLPRAALAPDGTLFTHGGFPLADRHGAARSLDSVEKKFEWLNSPDCLQDFSWTRITRYRSKIPNRMSAGCSYGFDDFAAFCNLTADFFPAVRLVTGHEHPAEGFDHHRDWKSHRALTLTGFGFNANNYDHPDAFTTSYRERLYVGRCRENDLPELMPLEVDKADLQRFFDAELVSRFDQAI